MSARNRKKTLARAFEKGRQAKTVDAIYGYHAAVNPYRRRLYAVAWDRGRRS